MRVPRKAKKQMKRLGGWFFKMKKFGYIINVNDTHQTIYFEYYTPIDGYITTKKAKKWIKTTYTK